MRYFTKEWYLACQTVPMTKALQRQLQEPGEAYRAVQAREALPDELRQNFHFHDGVVREVCAGADYTLCIDSPFSDDHFVTFHNALIRQEQPPVGAVWLYEELYRHKSGTGYEAHILFYAPSGPVHSRTLASDLIGLKIICTAISFA